MRCQCIDPAPIINLCGEITIDIDWRQLEVDTLQIIAILVVDCASSHFAIRREYRREKDAGVAVKLENIFFWREDRR